jgi:hypothetical protein
VTEVLFAWSWDGHGQITTAAVALAATAVTRLGRAGLAAKLIDLASLLRKAHHPFTSAGHKFAGMEAAVKYLLAALPRKVQWVDIHPGNAPWGIGEKLDKDGQVRHFMRSTRATTDREGYAKSMGWVRSHLAAAWQGMRDAVAEGGEETGKRQATVPGFERALGRLADALHTAEDSYAQGHVTRDAGNTNLIRELHYWDAANKAGDAAAGRLGHEEYDDPDRAENRPFVEAAKVTAGELIACVLSNLDRDGRTFAADLDRELAIRFAYCPPVGDFPAPTGRTRTA